MHASVRAFRYLCLHASFRRFVLGALLLSTFAAIVHPEAHAAVASYVVTVNTDTTNGSPGNCTNQNLPGATPDASCSLRDALAAAETGGGQITFSATAFAASQSAANRTITVVNGTLNIPSNTTITGLTTGIGWTLTNLVIVNSTSATGYNQKVSLFTIASGVTNAAISSLTITAGVSRSSGGGDILNHGSLTITSSTVSNGNTAGFNGGGIYNDGTLSIAGSTISGNLTYSDGGGIYNSGTLTIAGSTFSGNTANSSGGGIYNAGTLTLTNVTITDGAVGNVTATNSLLSGTGLAPLGVYGGPTATMPPLPGSAAICAGVSTSATTDQRGLPRTTTYGSATCIDQGAVQTNYSLTFAPEPPATVPAGANFTAGIQLNESSNPFKASGVIISLALAEGDPGSLNVSSLPTNSTGLAKSTTLQVGEPGTDDTLLSTLSLTAPGVTPPITLTATSTSFNVTPSNFQVTIAAAPAGLMVTADGVSYTSPVVLTWAVGSQHTLAVTSPQTAAGTQYTFASWSDGGAASHTVVANTGTPIYTASFTATMYQLNVAANPASGGTIGTASGNYYAPGTVVNLMATPNSGYQFTQWTGQTTGAIASPNRFGTTITMNAPETVTANFAALPGPIVVTTASDDATGTASNCPSASNCSLRDAIAAAAAAGAGIITFDSHVFATPQTITLGSGWGLSIPSNTSINITGPTTGSGATQRNLVTITGGGPVITVNDANAVLSNLTLTGGVAGQNGGGGIFNGGALVLLNSTVSGNTAGGAVSAQGGGISNTGNMTVSNSTISGNSLNGPQSNGGGIENQGTLTLLNSSVTGNSVNFSTGGCNVCYVQGGGIDNQGTLIITDSTIAGNSANLLLAYDGSFTNIAVYGGGISNGHTLTINNTTVAGNSVNASGLVNNPDLLVQLAGGGILGGLTGSNSILSGNSNNGSADDCDTFSGSQSCPTNGQNGNLVGSGVALAPLANYGGLTQTQPPLPGSTAICTGIIANIPAGVTTDQRGYPRTTTYGSNPPCVDSGAVQTNYSLAFSTQPPNIVAPNTNFTAAVQLNESGNPFPAGGVTIPLALGPGSTGSLSGGSAATGSTGIATYSTLQINAQGNGDSLVATLPLTASGVTPAANASATSNVFAVLQSGGPLEKPMMSPPGGTYTSLQTITITSTPGVTIYYTTDGSVPSKSSPVFNPAHPIVVSSSQIIKAYALESGYALSPLGVATYNIIPDYAATPTFSIPTGFYTGTQMLSISDTTPSAKIYYTTDRTNPTTSSALYTGPITITQSTQVQAIAVASNYSPSPVALANIYIATARPVISLPTGTYNGTQMVSITDSTPGAVIYYTTDGTTPSRSSPIFSGTPISVTSSQALKSIAVAPDYQPSSQAIAVYTITP